MAQHDQLLHGTLKATIFKIDRFPNKVRGCMTSGTKLYTTISLRNVMVGGTRLIEVGRTRLIECSFNPQWNESFHIYCAHRASDVIFFIKQHGSSVQFGKASIPVKEIFNEEELQLVNIVDKDNRTTGSKLHVKLQFLHATCDLNWSKGIMNPEYSGVPNTFFPQKNGCRVSLYQDAHIPDDFLPRILLSVPKKDEPHEYEEARGGDEYLPKFNNEPHRCWEDVFDAISDAKQLIYITGWSVNTEITLVRDQTRPKPGGDITLGQLLKKKAESGVKVLMLLWYDKTSIKKVNYGGWMRTHGIKTQKYFANTDVQCVLCPRHPNEGSSLSAENMIFTHHQKIVVVDSEIPNGETEQRRIVSFIGGLDLCGGRYDTPVHSIFRTLDAEHSADFCQPNFKGAAITKGGPRQPWHDIHCKLEGPIAWDVLKNFEQRWKKQGGDAKLRDLDTIIIPSSPVMFPEVHVNETWNVQLFRSIDLGAAFDFSDNSEDAARFGLVHVKDNIIDRSIQDAYINAIRRAKNFIYIENQYFLGRSFGWDSNELKADKAALHLIPKELSLKIVSKIEANERFTVYIVIPMWPEGRPGSKVVQALLKKQKMTMEMMYSDIAHALRAKGLEANPKDYLTFFCLGNREKKKSGEYAPPKTPKDNTDYHRAQQARRFMIYVHSKMMIVDDEYIIIGSANINQRSMDGGRDTEIAMGGYQPYHLTEHHPARGQIYGFRMALWYEHLGMRHEFFEKPESLECVKKVNQTAEECWGLYASETLDDDDLPGHLLSYPIQVTEDGKVTELPGTKFFPDTKARILGNISPILKGEIAEKS